MSEVTLTFAENARDLNGVLALQKLNYKSNVNPEEAQKQGFVSILHTYELLAAMNADYPHVIGRSEGRVIAYALVMLRKFGDKIPVLLPMFARLNDLTFQGKRIGDSRYFIMGQICIAKNFRGRGLFYRLYENLVHSTCKDFDFILTEVSARNRRSLRAHKKAGFIELKVYTAPDGEVWHIVLLDIRESNIKKI